MKKFFIILSLVLSLGLSFSKANAQVIKGDNDSVLPTPANNSDLKSDNLDKPSQKLEASRIKREKAYVKLLEGQRYIWSIRRTDSQIGAQTAARLAKDALQKAVELDPNLAEGYTALAELSLTVPPQDIEEAILLSNIAVKLDKDNFGAYRFLGRLYTVKSNLGRQNINLGFTKQAIIAWKEITRLDPRNAEAWAFLSSLYKETNQSGERITALRNWLSSATPLETGFYRRVMAQDGDLTPESAAYKLGEALLEAGKNVEALSILTRAVSDSPENLEVVELLSLALENADSKSLSPAIEALRQAVFSNPDNLSLNQLLAQTIARSGKVDDAAKFLIEAANKFLLKDKNTAASFQVSLGDIYTEANRTDEAIAIYKKALQTRGIVQQELANSDDRDFAFLVINKMITTYKKAKRFEDAKIIVDTYRKLFGKDDLSLDKEFIGILRENGKKDYALTTIRRARQIAPLDYNLIRSEASVLTDLGRVDEGVLLIQNLIDKKPANAAPSIMYDDYINYLYISTLFTHSKKDTEAIEYANKALLLAKGKERKQIAQLNLATAFQISSNFDQAEKILLSILADTPNNPIALNNLGYLFLESGKDFEKALSLINQAIRIDPRNPTYLDSLGWAYYKLGKFDEAEKYLIKAMRYDSSSAAILEHLGDVYIKKGKTDEAYNVWKKALELVSNTDDSKRLEAKITN